MPLDSHLPVLDAEQERLSQRLSDLKPGSRGLYVYGSVGRGKTWLCDAFFESLPGDSKRRMHFHEFFRALHESVWLNRTAGARAHAPVESAIGRLVDGVDLLYFDEFHVHDSGDAALITRVLEYLFSNGVTLLATSNYAPQALLPDPNFHDLIQPCVDLIEQNLDIVSLAGNLDYRRTVGQAAGTGFASGTWSTSSSLNVPDPAEYTTLTSGGHSFTAKRAADRQLWFRFADLCEADSAVGDYLAWASAFDVWVIESVPRMGETTMQARQRFANVVDVLSDQDVTLHLLSEHTLQEAIAGDNLPVDFLRTASRLALLHVIE